jgi:uncharacterized protein YeaO (DUF488 family)
MSIEIQRVYERPAKGASSLFLVDRLWPRGKTKEDLEDVTWIREVAPSASLRKWFSHDPKKWHSFMSRYFKELDEQPEYWHTIFEAAKIGTVTLLYGAKDTEHNQAIALKVYLDEKLKHSR